MTHKKRITGGRRQNENVRTGTSVETLKQAILDNLYFIQGRPHEHATPNDWYMALAYTVRDRTIERSVNTFRTIRQENVRVVAYLSAEFLMGPHLGNALINLGIYDKVRQAVSRLNLDLDDLLDQEHEPGLGNGGLGRLAACFLDSLATLAIPAIGYGIRYEFGIFDQEIRDGWQVEITDKWLHLGNPWEIPRPEITYSVNIGGRTEPYQDEEGRYRVRWVPWHVVRGVAYDTPVPAYGVNATSLLRLWKAEATESFDFQRFKAAEYYGAVYEKVGSETISKVLYPSDEPARGKQLRLAQQYFFVSCSLQDMIRIHRIQGHPLETFHKKFAVQLNDTHPSIAVAELMRLLVDEHLIDWDTAWEITRKTLAYTNHTLLPEAMENWPLKLFRRVLPRHLEIIYEINSRFLDEVRLKYPWDENRVSRLSIIDETDGKYVRMANLAIVGSHAVNGVATLHTDLLRKTALRDFYDLYPERFYNVTNGVTPRRWMVLSNPGLASLITSRIGDGWIEDLETRLKEIETFADDAGFQHEWGLVKRQNKTSLAVLIKERTGVTVDPDSLFDIQVKRIHEYKRQHLNVLHVITEYLRIKHDCGCAVTPRTVIFGGKAAPGYHMAKLIIKLINSIADVVNRDPDVAGRIKVVFVPDFNVKIAQRIYPAANLSEQISTAGKEASGTGNMKFSMNGALTIGTQDGSNVEIREEVGAENFFVFGLTAEEVHRLKEAYTPAEYYNADPQLKEVIDLIDSGFFSHGDRDLFKPLVDSLMLDDQYLLFADYKSYVDCQALVSKTFLDTSLWTRMSILNVARIGKFSSDRSIREYARHIWKVTPVSVEPEQP